MRVSDAVGTFAAVFILPEDVNITSGSPRSHRNFLDIYISQISRPYLRDLIEYQKILKQRNALLRLIKTGREKVGQLDVWDQSLAKYSLKIMKSRGDFTDEISPLVSKITSELSGSQENVNVSYAPKMDIDRKDEVGSVLNILKDGRPRDIKVGASLLGPHRDTLNITINDHQLRPFGSLGQKKTVMMAMKLAALDLLSRDRKEQAILVLDEAFAELDDNRSRALLGLLSGRGQVFLASASLSELEDINLTVFDVRGGAVSRREN